MSFIWKDDFILPKSASSVSLSQTHLAKRIHNHIRSAEGYYYYYLWATVKDKCYADKPETTDALKDNICEAIDEMQLLTIDYVLNNWTNSVGYCMASRGSHLNEIIFHY